MAVPALAQTPIPGHPRLLINDTIADTWDATNYPGGGTKGRLAAIAARRTGTASADWDYYMGAPPSSVSPPNLGGAPDGNLSQVLYDCFAYAVYFKAGMPSTANLYAAAVWSALNGSSGSGGPVYTINAISVSGTTATVTLATAPSPALTTSSYVAVWGASSDALSNSAGCYSCVVVTNVVDGTHFQYTTTGVAPGIYSGSTMLLAVSNYPTTYNQWIGGVDEDGYNAVALSEWAYLYDWCYPWLVANGHDQYARNQLKAGYWNTTLTRASSQFSSNVREGDYHNHASWDICALIEAGLALYGDDPFGATMFAEAAGYVYAGVTVTPVSGVSESYTYNLAASTALITQGAMNEEGPGYWREAATNHLRAIEAFDTATGRALNIWGNYYPQVQNAGWYKLYTIRPDGYETAFGDAGPGLCYTGRDNAGLVIINDRFPDAHFDYLMTSMGYPYNDWNMGNEGETGGALKLIFYPYVNGPGQHDFTDLPLSKQLGTDIIMRSGWTGNPSIYTYTNSVRGVYHRHEDSGSFTVWKGVPLITATPYTGVEPQQTMYNRRTAGGNTLTVYDPNDCWKQVSKYCGQWGDYPAINLLISNDGGQLMSERRLASQFAVPNLETADDPYLSRIWSGTLYKIGRAHV